MSAASTSRDRRGSPTTGAILGANGLIPVEDAGHQQLAFVLKVYRPASHMFRRFEKFCAVWLVAQILLPFTAPFPTCDLSDLLSGTHHDGGAPLAPSNQRVEGDYAFAPPLATTAGRLRLVVLATLEVSSVKISRFTTRGRQFAAAFGGQRQSLQIQATVLRL
jgi:hypothetical protein